MASRYVRIVSLWIHEGQEEAFEAFERDAAALMARFGGQIEKVVRPYPWPEGPHEIHIVTFPDQTHFEAYRDDPETRALVKRRVSIIARTDSIEGREGGAYLGSSKNIS